MWRAAELAGELELVTASEEYGAGLLYPLQVRGVTRLLEALDIKVGDLLGRGSSGVGLLLN
jgi:hypothetical protein